MIIFFTNKQCLSSQSISSYVLGNAADNNLHAFTLGELAVEQIGATPVVQQGFHNQYIIITSVYSEGKFNIQIYPNPAMNSIILECKDCNEAMQISFTDMLGNRVLSGSITSGNRQIDVSEFTPGVYIIAINSNQKLIYSSKLTKI